MFRSPLLFLTSVKMGPPTKKAVCLLHSALELQCALKRMLCEYHMIHDDHFGMQHGKLKTKVNSDLWIIVWKAVVDDASTDG